MRHAVATYAHGRVTPASYEHVQRGVQRACVDARQMPVVVADDLVDLEVPALDHLVVAHRKQVRMPVTGGPQARVLYLTHSPRTALMWPVSESLRVPLAKSQIWRASRRG